MNLSIRRQSGACDSMMHTKVVLIYKFLNRSRGMIIYVCVHSLSNMSQNYKKRVNDHLISDSHLSYQTDSVKDQKGRIYTVTFLTIEPLFGEAQEV